MSPALPPGPVSHFSRSLQCAHSGVIHAKHRFNIFAVASPISLIALLIQTHAAIPDSFPDLRCLNFHNPKLVPRI